MRKVFLLLVLSTFALTLFADSTNLLHSAREVYSVTFGPSPESRRFTLVATVTFVRQEEDSLLVSVRDDTGDIALIFPPDNSNILHPGLQLEISGYSQKGARAIVDSLTILGETAAPAPTPITGPELASGRFDCRLTRISGIVGDVARSELNINFTFLVLNCQGQKVYVSTPASKTSFDRLKSLINTQISADGICLPFDCTSRANMGRVFKIEDETAIHRLETHRPTEKPLPDIKSLRRVGPSDIAALGRHRTVGHVIAVWGRNQALLKTADGGLSELDFTSENRPSYGDHIEASGLPETDLFQVNLTHAIWRKLSETKIADDLPQDVTANAIITISNGTPHIHRPYHGQTIRIKGRIVSLPSAGSPDRRLYLANNDQLVPIEAQAIYERLTDVPAGSLVEISGTCIMDTEVWRPNMTFTKTKGFFLVTRTPDDIRVIARPSWWTPSRLMIIIGALFIVSIGILVWNLSLQRLSERKGKALAHATLAQSESALKVQERTRLATELHDSIVQNLTGVSLHLRTADKLRTTDPAAMSEQIAIAQRTVDSCRTEIRNCIWDLRNRALDEPNMDDAIQRTLAPLTEAVRLAVRFDVPRKCLTDNTTHNIICIIRELVLNAIRHGHATLIQIAGCLDDGQLLFSVKDNGIGFDVKTAPGIEQGHFGLQGVRERVSLMQGSVTVTSSSDRGTKISIAVRMPSENRK